MIGSDERNPNPFSPLCYLCHAEFPELCTPGPLAGVLVDVLLLVIPNFLVWFAHNQDLCQYAIQIHLNGDGVPASSI